MNSHTHVIVSISIIILIYEYNRDFNINVDDWEFICTQKHNTSFKQCIIIHINKN